jgi:hypothetical protein
MVVATIILRLPGCGSGIEGKPRGTATRLLIMGGKHMADGRSQSPKPPNGSNEQPTRQQWFPWAAGGGSDRAGGGSRRVLLVTLVACLCVVAVGVSVAVFSSPGRQASDISATSNTPSSNAPSGANTQAGQPTAPASSRASTGPKVKSNGVATVPLGWPSRLDHQMLHWRAGPGGTTLNAVEQHMGSAMQAAGVKLYASMKLACISLASDVGTAQSGPPIPYAAMQQLYTKALTGLSGAAADCRSAISEHPSDETTDIHVNKALLDQSRLEFAAMSKKLYRATAQIQSAHR